MKLIYPTDFINKVEEVFGKDSEAYKLAVANDESLGSLLNILTEDCYISLEEIVEIFENKNDMYKDYTLYSKAREKLEKKEVYDMWMTIFDESFLGQFDDNVERIIETNG